MYDLVIRGGVVVTAQGRHRADIGVVGETVTKIADDATLEATRTLDATGLLVLPGGVDPHVHLSFGDLPMDGKVAWIDDFESGSRAAFAGGVTTVGNMSFGAEDEALAHAPARDGKWVAKLGMADVFVHPVLDWIHADTLAQVEASLRSGHPSIKIFMSFPLFDEHFATYARAMEIVGRNGGIALMHCEDSACVTCCSQVLTALGGGLHHYGKSSPHAAELSAVQRAIGLCELTKCPTYIVHLSTAAALTACRDARARGLPIHVETRPIYLHLTDSVYQRPDPGLYVGQPPVRTPEDVEALWAGLFDGTIDTLGSDHAGWPREAKLSPTHTLLSPRPGLAELETMLPMLFSEGVHRRGLPLEKFVALTSENAARLFGLYPRKGTIAEGSDADLVIWDPEIRRTIDGSRMHSRTGYSVYDGTEVRGFPKWTVRRGEVVLTPDGSIHAERGSGRLLSRAARPGRAAHRMHARDGDGKRGEAVHALRIRDLDSKVETK